MSRVVSSSLLNEFEMYKNEAEYVKTQLNDLKSFIEDIKIRRNNYDIRLRPVTNGFFDFQFRKHLYHPSSIAYTCIGSDCLIETDLVVEEDELDETLKDLEKLEPECKVHDIHRHDYENHIHIVCYPINGDIQLLDKITLLVKATKPREKISALF